ncbi:MAG TPA: ABC transporter ATP-binding protein [Tenacibaculum sp.]|nr:ABC transporter ATP-binding protein [Tenacibaculum sp.]
MVKTKNLSFSYDNLANFSFPDIKIDEGEHLLILGVSGVGKTTLLYLMSGLLKPLNGNVFIDAIDINSLSRQKLNEFRGEKLGFIFQQYHFIKSLSLLENLQLRQNYPKTSDDKERRLDLMRRLGLDQFSHRKVVNLSQGQQQRLAIALGIVHKPKIVFADEPTSNLDDYNCLKVIELLKEEARISKSSLIIITHDFRIKSHFKNHIVL